MGGDVEGGGVGGGEVLCPAQNPFQTTLGVWPGLGAQPHSEAPGGIWIKILQTQD